MLNFFLERLRANENSVSPQSPKVIRAIDCKLISGYDAREVAMQLSVGTPVTECVDLTPIFFNRLFIAYLFRDASFDNTSWGVDAETYSPMEYVPKNPFAEKDIPFRYKWGQLTMTPDLMIIVNKNVTYALEACKVLIVWYKDRDTMYIDYCKKKGMRDATLWATRFHDIDSRAYDAYVSILTLLSNDDKFMEWLSAQPVTDVIEDMLKGDIICTKCSVEKSVDALGYCLNYLRDITSSVASGRDN